MKKIRLRKPKPCTAAIITKNKKILLTKRNKKLKEGGKWCLPGGHVDYGEKVEETMKRELKEETGLKIKKSKFLFYHDEIMDKPKLHSVVLVFKVETSGKMKPNWEVTESGWFSKKEIEGLDLAFTHRQIIKRFFKERKSSE